MYVNNIKLNDSCIIVLDAVEMRKSLVNTADFVSDKNHAVFMYDENKIYLNYNKTTLIARQETWIKQYGKFIIFSESSQGIEEFHTITDTFELFICAIFVQSARKQTKTLLELKTLFPNLFSGNHVYDEFLEVTAAGLIKNKTYKESCYSKNLFKAIFENNKSVINDTTIFTFFEISANEYSFNVTFTDNSEKFYDYSTKPPAGKGGPLFVSIINKLNLVTILSDELNKKV